MNDGFCKEHKDIKKLREATNFVNKYFPLPRCKHGNALRDHAFDKLYPTCGCLTPSPNRRRG